MTNNIFTAECPECGGDGKGIENDCPTLVKKGWITPSPCPLCQVFGWVMLVVECRDRMICDMDMDAMCSGVPVDGKCIGAYRPLTVAEVEELVNSFGNIQELFNMYRLKTGQPTFKNQPVHIRAGRESNAE